MILRGGLRGFVRKTECFTEKNEVTDTTLLRLLDDGAAVAGALEEAAEAADRAGIVELALHYYRSFGGGFVVL